MPFVAQDPDTGVAISTSDIGDEYNYREDFECPFCGDELRYRKASKDENGSTKRRGHFWHTEGVGGDGEAGGCSNAGESAIHEKWKEACGAMMMDKYDTDDFYLEYKIGDRVADAVIELDGDGDKRGIVTEYQRDHADKDYLDVTKHYLKFGYAVHWVFYTTEGYDMLFDAKNALEPYCESVYLGQGPANSGEGFIEFGTQLWFDNFDWVVTKPEDLNPMKYDPDGTRGSGWYSIYGKNIFVYQLAEEAHIHDEGEWQMGVESWNDVHGLLYTDSDGGGVLSNYTSEIKKGGLELVEPVV